MISIVILGNGRMARYLVKQLHSHPQLEIVQWYMREPRGDENQFGVSITTSLDQVDKSADLYIICISDDAIPTLAQQLAVNGLVVHTAGSVSIDALAPHTRRGVFYPLQTLGEDTSSKLSQIPLCLEASQDTDRALLERIAQAVEATHYWIDSAQRQILHLAAVLTNNFTNHLYTLSANLCEKHQIPFEILHPLILETAQKIKHLHPRNKQTGPALRNDQNTLNNHLGLLDDKTLKKLYQLFTQSIQHQHEEKLQNTTQ